MKIISLFLLIVIVVSISGCHSHYARHDSRYHPYYSGSTYISPQIRYRVIKKEVYRRNYSTGNSRPKHYRGGRSTPPKHYRNDRKKRLDNRKKSRDDRKWNREMDRTFRYRR